MHSTIVKNEFALFIFRLFESSRSLSTSFRIRSKQRCEVDRCLSSSIYLLFSLYYKAHGWFGAKGIARRVPSIYCALEYELLKRMENRNSNNAFNLFEFCRDGYSYHAKGIWAREGSDFFATIGSSNFSICLNQDFFNSGERSINADMESQLIIKTRNLNLISMFEKVCVPFVFLYIKERDDLLKHSQSFSTKLFDSKLDEFNRSDSKSLDIRLVASYLKRFL